MPKHSCLLLSHDFYNMTFISSFLALAFSHSSHAIINTRACP
ncbi:conserved hypothetical protein [Moraxellaceae bacterium 17A]|nr:conserved hypothetical protein [Moraxellaceae bacterium 17A]